MFCIALMASNLENQSPASLLPFWFWNGRITSEGIREQVSLITSQGVGGFFIAPRQGLDVPYLSAGWFDLVRVAVEAAGKHNMQVWIYDEYPYPSGMAGGAVTQLQPQARHRTLERMSFQVAGGERVQRDFPKWQMLSLQAVPLGQDGTRDWSQCIDLLPCGGWLQRQRVFQKTGLTAYNDKRFFTAEPVFSLDWQVPGGQWEIHAFAEMEIEDFKYYGHYMDPCNAGAVGQFIALTHERYAAELGDHFGKTIRGFFTDETGFLGRLAWSPCLPEYFLERNGYDLIPALPALSCRDWPGFAKVRYDYWQTLHELLRERYHQRIRDWCCAHGLRYIAETPSLRATTQLYADIPATDSGHEKLGASIRTINRKNMHSLRYNPKMAASLACQRGIRDVLVECFHSVGWSMTLQDAKWMVDRFFAMGVNCFNPHAFFYTTDDLRKHDAPPSLFYQNSYWQHFHQLSDYMRNGSEWLKAGVPICPIAVLDPITSLWTRMGNPMEDLAFTGDSPQDARELTRLRDDWVDLTSGLLAQQRDYQHVDPEMLAQAEVSGGFLRLGEAAYSVVVLPPLVNLESAAWQKLQAFVADGGMVIGCGHLPTEAIEGGWSAPGESADPVFQASGLDPAKVHELFGLAGNDFSSYWELATTLKVDPADKPDSGWRWVPRQAFDCADDWVRAILREADACSCPPVSVELTPASDCVLVSSRVANGRLRIFVSNQGDKPVSARFRLDKSALLRAGVELGAEPCEWLRFDFETAQPVKCGSQAVEDLMEFSVTLEAFHSGAWEMGVASGVAKDSPDGRSDRSVILPLAGEWELRLPTSNSLRLDRFVLWANEERLGNVDAIPFIHQCADLNPGLPLQYRQVFGTPVQVKLRYPIPVRYVTSWVVESIPDEAVLCWEEKTLGGVFDLTLNGKRIGSSAEGRRFPIRHLLRQGENTLTLTGSIKHDAGGLADALYLEGPFGVCLKSGSAPCLTKLPNRCSYPLPIHEPLPYYAGSLQLRQTIAASQLTDEGIYMLVLPEAQVAAGACIGLVVDGIHLGTRAWTPYQWTYCVKQHPPAELVVELHVCCGLEGKFEGRYFDADKHRMVSLLPTGK